MINNIWRNTKFYKIINESLIPDFKILAAINVIRNRGRPLDSHTSCDIWFKVHDVFKDCYASILVVSGQFLGSVERETYVRISLK